MLFHKLAIVTLSRISVQSWKVYGLVAEEYA
jgi:hypothetical protein